MKRTNKANLLFPTFHKVIQSVQAEFKEATGHKIVIHETYRSQQRQDYLYEQGRTRNGPIITNAKTSIHKLGLACDFVGDIDPMKPGIQGPYDINWPKFGAIVIKHDLVWGGVWGDSVHVEMRAKYTTKQIFEMYEEQDLLYIWDKIGQYYDR